MKELEEMEQKVNAMIQDRNKEIDSLENAVTKDQVDIENARALMDGATDAGDLDKYQKAKSKLQNARDSLEMHSNRLDKLQNEPLIDKLTYDQMIKTLTDAMDAEVKATIPKLAKATWELEGIGDGLQEDGNRTNNLLKTIQAELFKNQDRHKNSNGSWIESPRTYKRHFACVEWSQEASHGNTYKAFMKEQEAANSGKS